MATDGNGEGDGEVGGLFGVHFQGGHRDYGGSEGTEGYRNVNSELEF